MSDVFWAAFGGGAAAGIFTLLAVALTAFLSWFADRPLIKTKTSLGFIVSQASKNNQRQIFIEAVNPHSKPVTLVSFGFAYNNPKWGTLQLTPQFGYTFPYRLDGGTSINQWSTVENLLKVLKESDRKPEDLKYAWYDSSLKRYQSEIPKWVIDALTEEFNKT